LGMSATRPGEIESRESGRERIYDESEIDRVAKDTRYSLEKIKRGGRGKGGIKLKLPPLTPAQKKFIRKSRGPVILEVIKGEIRGTTREI